MSDKSLGLGKLLAKSKSTIRRARKGSIDGSNSIDSDDATTSSPSFSRDHSSFSRMSQPVLDSHDFHSGPWTGSGDNSSIVIRVPAVGEKDEGEESTTSLVSSVYDPEDPELL